MSKYLSSDRGIGIPGADTSWSPSNGSHDAIVNFNKMHHLLLLASKADLTRLTQEEIVGSADDFTANMTEIQDRVGIEAGNPDGTRHVKFIDQDARVWLAKDYPLERRHRVLADEFVSGLSTKLGLSTTMEAKAGALHGDLTIFVGWEDTIGSLWDDLRESRWQPADLVARLSEQELKQIASEQVLDWLVSNHDSHLGHFLRRATGGFVCIDKAQAFKYIGNSDEQLSATYNPNGPNNGFDNISYMPIYNIVLPIIAKGQGKLSLKDLWVAVAEKIEIVEHISDEDYRKALLPYANLRFGVVNSPEDKRKGLDVEGFLNLALERKRNIRRDFIKFYEDLKAAL
ncbi:MAG: hypothetical protein NTU97_02000 [Candidatus Magasanikbacteria bacterium]|nr:hypothetical protein [Candidatus Magasanikbacteria bacterium]